MTDIYTVSQFADYLSSLLRTDEQLSDVYVAGEISNAMLAKSGHFYFSLKDAGALMSCVMWRPAARALIETPVEGQRVVVHGRTDFYAPRGQVQLVVDALRPEGGIGDLYRRFAEIKARLQAEGLFEAERKRELPALPGRIAVVTSATGAALRDILRVLHQRWPLADVLLVPSLVQGEQAPAMLQAALYTLYQRSDVDVILLARGGGSIEDLWAFNDEGLARLIAASPVPVVTGIGHETDFTIADFVADLRAPTPSAAAVAVTPDAFVVRQQLDATAERLADLLSSGIERRRSQVERALAVVERHSPRLRLAQQRQAVVYLGESLRRAAAHRLQQQRQAVIALEERLLALNPTAVLGRGYAIVRDESGRVVRSVVQVAPGQAVDISVSDGSFPATVGAMPFTPASDQPLLPHLT